MDKYTRKFFFEEIERILNQRPVEQSSPTLLFIAEDGLTTLLDASGNKVVGELFGILTLTYDLGLAATNGSGAAG